MSDDIAKDAVKGVAGGAMPPSKLDMGTRLALHRTFLAHERTQMAWVRTALALIGFGFTIAKFFEYLHEKQGDKAPLLGSRAVGMLMISLGIFGLLAAVVQHRRAMKWLRAECPELPMSVAGTNATLLAFLGLLALIGAALRS